MEIVEIVFNFVSEIAKSLAPHVGRQCGYLCNYRSNFENLKSEVEKLKGESASRQHEVDEAKRKGEEIEENVAKWLESANKFINDVTFICEHEETATKNCLKGLCPNLKTRYQLSKKASKWVGAIVKCREEGSVLQKVSYHTIREDIWLRSNKGYEAFESRSSISKDVRRALTDPNVSIIGVHGMGGIGKTTLVKEVARKAKEDKIFDQVVLVEVTQTPKIKNIQGEIAEKLCLPLTEESESRRASSLYERLRKEEKILVVFDNLWKYLDLETVGIPYGDEHRGCKILLTARDRNVLLSMGSKENFSVGILKKDEAWILFKMTVGDDVDNSTLRSTATNVAHACGGLPVALTTIAKALRNRSIAEWKNVLHELRTPSKVNFEGVPAEAYSTIELSYKCLKGEQLKTIFLLCSLITPASIKDLLKYGMGLRIFQGVYKLEDALNKLDALVHELKDSCLLLEDDSTESFSMHDVVRDVAISIACRDKHAFSVRNEDLWDWPNADERKKCYAISVRDSRIHELPEELECPQLEFLCINPRDSFLEINFSQNFFKGAGKLRVVDLTKMRLFSVPSSIGLLVNLQTLCLNGSTLEDIGIIGKLKNLEVLSLVECDIVKLPRELGQLTKLRLLDLTNCFKLKGIAPNVLSSLTRLEALYMRYCFVEWEVEEPDNERNNASLEELMLLPHLTTLEIDVTNSHILPEGLLAIKLERFKISIGDGSFKPPLNISTDWFHSRPYFLITNHESLRTLKLKVISKPISSKNLQGVKNVEYLCLDKFQGVKNILFELDVEGFSQLQHLHVQNNPEFLQIVDSMERVTFDAFPLLKSFTLQNLINLETICVDQLKEKSFNELQIIRVENCDRLNNIFRFSGKKFLQRLERLAVINCSNLKDIFAIGEESDVDHNKALEKIEFAQLRYLSLGNLPKLATFYCNVKMPSATSTKQESQEELTSITCSNEIMSDDKLETSTCLFNDQVVFPNLEVLELSKVNVERIWHSQPPAMFPCFQSLTQLIVWRCNKLKYIFSASMIQTFEQLQHLDIRFCEGLLEIISKEVDQVTSCFVFPQLTILRLVGLPELRCLYPGLHNLQWPALKRLTVLRCDKLKIFGSELNVSLRNIEKNQLHIPVQQPLLFFEKIFPDLEELVLNGKDMKMILQGDFPQHLFSSLNRLEVVDDDSSCFALGLLERCYNLEYLLLNFTSYEEILSNGGHLENRGGKFALIKRLDLFRLDNLKQLWRQDSKLDSIFRHLETLLVTFCQNLTIMLPPSSESFHNLKEVQVYNCKKLLNLVTSSTAKCLVQLMSMQIFGCVTMTEVVVADTEREAKEEIAFDRLKTLSLVDLSSLTSFCSGSHHTFNFPSLKDLNVIGCPKLKIFTTGELSTPHRVEVWYGETEDKLRWSNDLNSTIQQLQSEKLLEESSQLWTSYDLI